MSWQNPSFLGNDLCVHVCLLKVAARRRRNRERRARITEVKHRAAVERALRPGVTVSTYFKAKGGAQSATLRDCVVTKIKEGDDGYMVKILLPSGLKQKIPLAWVQAVVATASNTLQHNASKFLTRLNTTIVKEGKYVNVKKKGKKKLSEEERAQEIAKRKRAKRNERKRNRREKHLQQAEDKERVDIDRTIEEKIQRKKERCACLHCVKFCACSVHTYTLAYVKHMYTRTHTHTHAHSCVCTHAAAERVSISRL